MKRNKKTERIFRLHEKSFGAREADLRILKIFEHIDKLPYEEIVRVGHAVNKWEWPDVLPDKPEGWDRMSNGERYRWSGPIREYVKGLVGEKALLRHYHKSDFGVSDQAFDDWWDSSCFEALTNRYHETDDCDSQAKNRHNGAYYAYRIIEIATLAIGSFLLGALLT